MLNASRDGFVYVSAAGPLQCQAVTLHFPLQGLAIACTVPSLGSAAPPKIPQPIGTLVYDCTYLECLKRVRSSAIMCGVVCVGVIIWCVFMKVWECCGQAGADPGMCQRLLGLVGGISGCVWRRCCAASKRWLGWHLATQACQRSQARHSGQST